MNYEPLMNVVVQAILFLELSDDQAVDLDAAVGMLEAIATTLQKLGAQEKDEFLRYVQKCAVQASSDRARELLENLPDCLGLTPE